jgi:hypothetical protein
LSASNSGSYKVTVTYAGGCTSVSNPVSITVNSVPLTPIISPNTTQNICINDTITFITTAVNGLTYQWLKNGTAINGATSNI